MDDGLPEDRSVDGEVELPLSNYPAEAAVLGALMVTNAAIEPCSMILEPQDFYDPAHQKLYRLILSFAEEGKEANPVSLRPIVARDPVFKPLGGARYLAELTGGYGSAGVIGWRDLARQVAEFSRLREIKEGAEDAVALYLTGEHTLTDATAALDEAVAKAISHETPVEVMSGGDLIRKVRARSERITEQAVNSVGPTCRTVSDLNTLLGPLDPSYILLAGRPGMGKSTLAGSAAWGYAANGHPTAYYAAEGTDEGLAMRFMSDLSLANGYPIPHDSIRRDKLTPSELLEMGRLEEKADLLPLEYQVIKRIDVRRLRSYVARSAARWKAKGRKLEVVFVDYLQLLDASIRGKDIDDDRRRVNAISRALLGIVQDFGVTLFALSQLNRGVEARLDKRPQVADLRESGRLEEDADQILLLYREEYYLADAKPQEGTKDYQALLEDWEIRMGKCRDRVDIILGKNRHGERRTRTARFYGKYYAIRGGDYTDSAQPDETGWIL